MSEQLLAAKRRLAISCRKETEAALLKAQSDSRGRDLEVPGVHVVICSSKSARLEIQQRVYTKNARTRPWPMRGFKEMVIKRGPRDISDQYDHKYPLEDNGYRAHYPTIVAIASYGFCYQNRDGGLDR